MPTLATPIARPQTDIRTFRVRQQAEPAAPVEGGEDWLRRWCEATSFEERLSGINALSRKRLPSHMAGEVWLHLMNKASAIVTPAQLELLLRQFIALAPEHGKANVMYDMLMNGQATEPSPELVFMITSCEKYLPQAERVLRDLKARGAQARIVTGDPSLTVGVQDGDRIRLPVSDAYEALPSKVLEGLTFLRRRHGPAVSIVKIDDDMWLNGNFDPTMLARTARTMDYAGQPIGEHAPDRCWHLGKTTTPTPVFTRRHHGRFAYGPMYVLGPRAIEHLVREWLFYPGEFAGHVYEDRAVGDCLRKAGIELRPVSFEAMGGVVDESERFVTA